MNYQNHIRKPHVVYQVIWFLTKNKVEEKI